MEQEVWKPIEKWKYYQVSNLGRVKSNNIWGKRKKRDKRDNSNKFIFLSLFPDRDGYLRVELHQDKNKKLYYVHRLVAMLFCKIPEHLKEYNICDLFVNHINHQIKDNRSENLEWVTNEENLRKKIPKIKISKSIIKKIISLHKKKKTVEEIELYCLNNLHKFNGINPKYH